MYQVLSPAFGGMIAFVKETEPLLERGQGQVIRPDESKSCQQINHLSPNTNSNKLHWRRKRNSL